MVCRRRISAFWLLLSPVALLGVVLLTGCPLPFEFSGEGASGDLGQDPSSPGITAPVTVSYQQSEGPNGSVADGATANTIGATTITLSTDTDNAVIYFTDDGSPIVDLNAVNKIDAAEGQIDLSISNPAPGNYRRTMQVRAVAVGPGMRPSPEVNVTVTTTYLSRVTVSTVSDGAGSTVPQAQTDVELYGLLLDTEGADSTFAGLDIRLGGPFGQFDIRRLRLWRSDDASFDPSADTPIASQFANGGFGSGDDVSFTASQTLTTGSSYFFITATIDSIATPGNSVFVDAVSLEDIDLPDTLEVLGGDPLPAGPTRTFGLGTNDFALVSEREYRDRRFALNNIVINGAARTQHTVSAGTPVTITFDFESSQLGDFCPDCRVQAYVGFYGLQGDASACVANFTGYNGTATRTLSFTPTDPGLYYLTAGGSLEFPEVGCLLDPWNRVSYFDAGQNFAVILVTP